MVLRFYPVQTVGDKSQAHFSLIYILDTHVQVFQFDAEEHQKFFGAQALSQQWNGIARIKSAFFTNTEVEDNRMESKEAGGAPSNIWGSLTYLGLVQTSTTSQNTSQSASEI